MRDVLFFGCSSLMDKLNRPWRYTEHASDDGQRTLCGRRINLHTTWTRSAGQGCRCERCDAILAKRK